MLFLSQIVSYGHRTLGLTPAGTICHSNLSLSYYPIHTSPLHRRSDSGGRYIPALSNFRPSQHIAVSHNVTSLSHLTAIDVSINVPPTPESGNGSQSVLGRLSDLDPGQHSSSQPQPSPPVFPVTPHPRRHPEDGEKQAPHLDSHMTDILGTSH